MIKLYLSACFILIVTTITAQQKVRFEYDASGNQRSRVLCFDCEPRNTGQEIDIADITDQDLQKFYPEDIISYYPNPVKEELYLQWELIEKKNIEKIEVYSITGQLLNQHVNLASTSNLNLQFGNYPAGIYNILLTDSEGTQTTVKIIKN